jgi:sulfur-oxidizing protein SoxZ
MAKKSRIKAKSKKGIVTAKVLANHVMMSYDEAKKKKTSANFITRMVATVNGKTVYEASTSQFLSKNPFIQFKFAGEKGSILEFTWTDLSGKTKTDKKKIK